MELIENNEKIYQMLRQYESTKVLNVIVKRGIVVVGKQVNGAENGVE